MALREFTASDGKQWRVWDVTPEGMHPATRSEDYLADYLDGWLVFESTDGTAKCRLHPIPRGWNKGTDAQLEKLLHAAEPIRGDRTSGPHGRTAIEDAEAERLGIRTARGQTRTFRFPGGRYWTVTEWAGGTSGRTVLRFGSGARSLELGEWPEDWASLSDEDLCELLVQSFPREARHNPTTFRRRATDSELR